MGSLLQKPSLANGGKVPTAILRNHDLFGMVKFLHDPNSKAMANRDQTTQRFGDFCGRSRLESLR